ncbi:MMPL family transporter [Microlunatus soli]|uniref:Putative drug exporter of the RND superfamily n=1 Tax=Microlunatus soli TaxID=630515 RepID=A0A1H1X860_9ACTN|nr:MMPL family transporter [Microlunatus soli]SDT05402.1 putative drug exporter of the RND superfamily [Microlunatus soli]
MTRFFNRLATLVTGRSGAWLVLAAMLMIAAGAIGGLRGAEPPTAVAALPTGSESANVAELQKRFPHHESAPVMLVVTRPDGADLSKADLAVAADLGARAAEVVDRDAPRPIVSADGAAVVLNVMINADRPNAEIAVTIQEIRTAVQAAAPEDLAAQVTGGPAFGADIASAFDGANFTLLAVTIGIVAVLLLLTYRSPVLWLIPLSVVGLADQLAAVLTAAVGAATDLPFDKGIISVLVFGAGTNYALLLISRYREELYGTEDHRTALAAAVRGTGPAILASNITVVVSLLTLLLALMPNTRGLGVAAAVGLVVALVFTMLLLPATLALFGRRLFWPLTPRPDRIRSDAGGAWRRVAQAVTSRPLPVVLASIIGLAVLATGLFGTRVGLSQLEQFRVQSESAAGLEIVARHFPAGETAPLTVIANSSQTEQVITAAEDVSGVDAVRPAGTSGDGLVKISVIGSAEPGSEASLQTVRDLRAAVREVPGADAQVGGQSAEDLDVRGAFERDLRIVAPLIIAVAFVLLMILLRSLLAPALLVLINAASAIAAIGAGTFVGKRLFGFPALDVNVPLVGFLFLVALGIDYTIFLAHRVRQESRRLGTRDGVVEAVGHTGAVITSAGVVLAAVFAALGVLPLTTLAQLGLIVGLGVLVDTLFVRSIVVPAVISLVGDRIWWPGRSGNAH